VRYLSQCGYGLTSKQPNLYITEERNFVGALN
jgi:hypothetical protein